VHNPVTADISLCRRCGRCCWDWKGGNPADKCEHLAEDMVTCLVYDRRAEVNRAECDPPMQPHQTVDLPPDCGYMIYWREQRII